MKKITIEKLILKNLLFNDQYTRKVLPYLNNDYFENYNEKNVFKIIKKYFNEYNTLPEIDFLLIEWKDKENVSQQDYDNTSQLINELSESGNNNIIVVNTEEKLKWLVDRTEKFCKDKALDLALGEAIQIFENKNNESTTATSIPNILEKALAVSFDVSLGHNYIQDAEKRFEINTTRINKIPCHLDMINKITNGGFERKSVTCLAAGTGGGKSMMLCDFAANYYKQGYNVLYCTMEMSETKIADRIDSNILDIPINYIKDLNRSTFKEKIDKIKSQYTGSITIKEYPLSSAGALHFKQFIQELKQKQNTKIDILIVDYMNICCSNRYSDLSNSYSYVKSIAEELRALAQELNIVLLTATQLNRSGNNNSDVDITSISESMGGPMTFDCLLAIISTEELSQQNRVIIKQLKNRFGDVFVNNKFPLGVDRNKMRFFNPT